MEAGDAFKEEEKIQVWTDRSIAIAMALTCIAYWLFGAAVFMAMEPDWDYLESVWFCFVTISTTGFGDYFPSTPRSWQFWTYYSLFNIALWAYALSVLGNLLHSQSGSLIEFHHKDTGV
ncbi:hypothetical protein DFJ74DRAFT_710300 [Hyaloraphidium curvatum]|nr:hypothetical protein DFJ74DRAFT_710300 [Hyaloraphidium curvatum]